MVSWFQAQGLDLIIDPKDTFPKFDFSDLFARPFWATVDNNFSINIFEEVDHFALSSSVFFLFFYGLFVVDVESGISIFEDAFASWSDWFDIGGKHLNGFVAGDILVFVIKLNLSECFDKFFFGILFADVGGSERIIILFIVIDCIILNSNISCNRYSALSRNIWFNHDWYRFSINLFQIWEVKFLFLIDVIALLTFFRFYTSIFMAAIWRLSGEKLPNSFKSLRALLSWFFCQLDILYLFVDLAPSHEAQYMVRILVENFIKSIKGSLLVA